MLCILPFFLLGYSINRRNWRRKNEDLIMVSAVICEYNPFHNGHRYQLEQMKKESDAVICIMSGDFVQRGAAAIYDKFIRTKAALLSGADLVIMLPVVYSLSPAELFALGGVSLCDSLGAVDRLYFGTECGDISQLLKAAELLMNEPPQVSGEIQRLLSGGKSYPAARAEAFSKFIDNSILGQPNNILAIEYIKALMRIKSSIKPIGIKRNSAGHHDFEVHGSIASASAIRSLVSEDKAIEALVPDNAYELYKNAEKADTNNLSSILMYTLRTKSAQETAEINEVTEGLENRIISSVYHCAGFNGICEYVKSKRYTKSKISRILLSILLGIDKEMPKKAPEYIRVLGMNKKGMELLSDIKRKSALPVITKTADYKGFCDSFEKDIFASDLYTICRRQPDFGHDFKTSPVIM